MLRGFLIYILLILGFQNVRAIQQDKVSAETYVQKAAEFYDLGFKLIAELKNKGGVNLDSLNSNMVFFDSSNFYYEKAAGIYRENKDWENFVFTSYKISRNYNLLKENFKAIKILSDALTYVEQKETLPDNLKEYYYKLGAYYYKLAKYQNALGYFFYYLHLISNEPVSLMTLNSYKQIAQSYSMLGNYDEAIKFSQLFIEKGEPVMPSNSTYIAGVYVRMAEIYQIKNEPQKAESHIKKAIEITESAQNPIQLLHFKEKLVEIYRRNGKFDAAIVLADSIIQSKIKIFHENHQNLISAYFTSSILYNEIGDIHRAIEYAEKVLTIKKKYVSNESLLLDLYYILASLYFESGNYTKAKDYIENSIKVIEKNKNIENSMIVNFYGLLSKIYINQNENYKAIEILSKNIDLISLTEKDQTLLASSYIQMAEIYLSLNLYEEAQNFYELAFETAIENQYFNNFIFVNIYDGFSNLAFVKKDYQSAINYAKQSISENIGSDFNEISPEQENFAKAISKEYLLKNIYRIALSKSNIKTDILENRIKANEYYKITVKIFDELRQSFKNEDSKFLLAGKTNELFENAIKNASEIYHLTGDQNFAEDGFMFSEKGRSNILLDALTDINAMKFADIPDSLLETERNFQSEIRKLNTLIEHELQKEFPDQKRIETLQDNIFDEKQRYNSFILNLENNYGDYYRLKYNPRAVRLSKIKMSLDESTVLTEYFTGKDNLFIFVIGNESVEIKSVPVDSNFYENVKKYHAELNKGVNLIREKNKANFLKLSHTLYEKLIEPVEKEISNKKNLVIIPNGELFYLPFESLISKRKKSLQFSDQDFLIKKFNIAYQYSANLYLKNSQNKKPQDYKKGFVGFAPSFGKEKNSSFLPGNGGVYSQFENGFELAYAKEEVTNIKKMFEKNNISASVFLDEIATKTKFKETVSNDEVFSLHVATHGIVNEENPDYTALVFANGNEKNLPSFLYSGELFALDVKSELVVLSSCESGLGKIAKGEGVLALTRGFIYSGVPNILFSLWKVNDKTTGEVMVEFYEKLLEGENISSALHKAKIEMLKNEVDANPAGWAAFILVGK